MKVPPALLDLALTQPQQGIELVNRLSHASLAPPPSALGPGTWVYGGSRALMRHVLASNPAVNVFHTGFKACDNYVAGMDSMAKVTCPTVFVLGEQDQMTPPKAALGLLAQAQHGYCVTLQTGHHLMNETPEALLLALTRFLVPR